MKFAYSRRAILAAAPAALLSAEAAAQTSGLTARRLAWAGVALRRGDVELFVDARAPNAEEGAPGPALASEAARRFALVTHHHGDHLDIEALRPVLGERGYIVTHESVARLVNTSAISVQQVAFYEPVFLSRTAGEFVARCVPAADGFGSAQVSWIVDGGGQRVIHCGDMIWHGGLWDIARAFGPFDAAFMPINGARQIQGRFTDTGQPMVMTPEQAIAAADVLGARLAIPIHYGAAPSETYVEESNVEARFIRAARARNLRTRIMQPGESMVLQ